MPSFAELLQQSAGHAWLFVPSAVLLGALHGLEPGHSKTMMAAFIVAIRGTILQAVLLGLAATVSHTAVVWGIALGGMYLWQGVNVESFEPYMQLASAAIIIAIALWMLQRTLREQRDHAHGHDHEHGHADHRGHGAHSHGDELRHVEAAQGTLTLEIFEDGVPPRWRLRAESGPLPEAADIVLTTARPNGERQGFTFVSRGSFLESVEHIPEPHEFETRLSLGPGATEDVFSFVEPHHHHHGDQGLNVSSGQHEDAHERAHAHDIRRRFADSNVTTAQIVVFGLTGGLIPCPAAVTILLLCIQLKHLALGAVLVLCFSIGLAVTLVTVGVAASLGVQQATKRVSWFAPLMRRAPYVSSLLIILVGLYTAWQGWHGLALHTA